MPSYSDQEKIIIAKEYLLPRILKDSGLKNDQVIIKDSLWPKIVRPLGYDAGVRSLKRNIDGFCRQIARKVVSGEGEQFTLDENNINQYLSSW